MRLNSNSSDENGFKHVNASKHVDYVDDKPGPAGTSALGHGHQAQLCPELYLHERRHNRCRDCPGGNLDFQLFNAKKCQRVRISPVTAVDVKGLKIARSGKLRSCANIAERIDTNRINQVNGVYH